MIKKLFGVLVLMMALVSVVAANPIIGPDQSTFTGTITMTAIDAQTVLTIDQNYNHYGAYVDSEATDYSGLYVEGSVDGTGGGGNDYAAQIISVGAGGVLRTYRNQGTATDPVVYIDQDHATDNQRALFVKQDGTSQAVYIDNNGGGNGIYVDNDGTAPAVYVDQAGANTALHVKQDTGNYGVFVDQNGNYVTLEIDSEATSAHAIVGNVNANAAVFRMGDPTSGSGTYYFERDEVLASTSGAVMTVKQTNAGDDQPALNVQNYGTNSGINVAQNGVGNGIYVDQNANSDALVVDNSGNQASIALTAVGGGLEMKSPDSTVYCFTIANGGTTSIAAGGCTA